MMRWGKKEQLYYCRWGMVHSQPLTRLGIRRNIYKGIFDARTLISVDNSGSMLPLGASEVAGEITAAVKKWKLQFSPLIYAIWLFCVPLVAAAAMSIGIWNRGNYWMFWGGFFCSLWGLSIWLYRTWQVLLSEEKNWLAAFYALPMMIPYINCIWIWIGYMSLPGYWRRFKKKHNIREDTPHKLYYLVMVLFYLSAILDTISLYTFLGEDPFFIRISVGIGWLWFGATIMSLFLTDQISARMVQMKLSRLAFGAVRFFADIDYDVLHRAVQVLAVRMQKKFFYLGGTLLLISWVAGGTLLIYCLSMRINN